MLCLVLRLVRTNLVENTAAPFDAGVQIGERFLIASQGAGVAASEDQNSSGRQLISSSRGPTKKENEYEDLRGQPIL